MNHFYDALPAVGHKAAQLIFDYVAREKYGFILEIERFFQDTIGSSDENSAIGSYGCSKCSRAAVCCVCGRFKQVVLRPYDFPRPSDLKLSRRRCKLGDCTIAFVFREHAAALRKRRRLGPTQWA